MKRKHIKGISLVEIILSIGILSILSIYILQMFLTSKELNVKAQELDTSITVSEMVLEQIDSVNSDSNILAADFFKYAQINNLESIWEVYVYLDSKWQSVSIEKEHDYILKLIKEDIPALNYVRSNYNVSIYKQESLPINQETILYEVEMQKYDY